MALFQAALTEMDQDDIAVTNRALAHMNDAYNSGESYSEMRNLFTIPDRAYLSAIGSDTAAPEANFPADL